MHRFTAIIISKQHNAMFLFTQEILEHVNQFVALRKRAHCHAHNDLHLRPKSATLDSCIGVLAIAMSMVRRAWSANAFNGSCPSPASNILAKYSFFVFVRRSWPGLVTYVV